MLITACERGPFLICLLVKRLLLNEAVALSFFFFLSFSFFLPLLIVPLSSCELSPDSPPQAGTMADPGAQLPHRPRREEAGGLGTEGAAQHGEIWRRQIRWQRHTEALSQGPEGKFAVIKRKMREIKWLLYSFSQTSSSSTSSSFFYYFDCLHLRDERSGK